MTALCSPNLLNQLIEKKEYRILPAPLWRLVQSNPNLSVEARFLWTVLWELCSASRSFEKNLTWSFLSKRVGKSESTIRRWSRQLQSFGFLEIENRFSDSGGQLPSIFRIGVPQTLMDILDKKFPNRRKVSRDFPDANKSENTPNIPQDIPGSESIQKPASDGKQIGAGQGGVSICGNSDIDSESAEKYEPENPVVEQSAGDCALSLRIKAIQKRAVCSQVKRSEKTNTTTADFGSLVSRELTERRQNQPEKGSNRVGEGVATSDFNQAVKSGTQENKPNNSIQGNNGLASLRELVKSELTQRLPRSNQLVTYIEEVAVAMKWGSLKKFTFAKGINIAAKLIREGRWESPRYKQDSV